MFGRTVKIDGREIFVTCNPNTPYSDICRRAARIFLAEEQQQESKQLADEMAVFAQKGNV